MQCMQMQSSGCDPAVERKAVWLIGFIREICEYGIATIINL